MPKFDELYITDIPTALQYSMQNIICGTTHTSKLVASFPPGNEGYTEEINYITFVMNR